MLTSDGPSPVGSPSAEVSLAPTSLPPGPDVTAAGLLDSLHGWVVIGERLLLTEDGGTSWRDAVPPGGLGDATSSLLRIADTRSRRYGMPS